MITSTITRMALRTLSRHRRRTLLSVVGIGVGCALTLFMQAFMRSGMEIRVRAIAQSGYGHLRVAPAGWAATRGQELRLEDWQETLARVRADPGVAVAAPHARATGLLAFGTRSVGVELLGVDPAAELAFNRFLRAIVGGRYLESTDRDAVVVGRSIAARLEVEVDDALLLTVVDAAGELQYAMLRIAGIVATGSRDIDAGICHVLLEDLARLTGRTGAAEITVTVVEPRRLERVAARLAQAVPAGNEVLTWRQVLPAQGGDARSDRAFSNLLAGTVVIVVALGVSSAQLTAVLERRREFAVLLALGMRGSHVVRLVVLEAAMLGAAGAAAGLLLGLGPVYYAATRGIDFAAMIGGELALSGVLFDPVFYSDLGWWMVPHAAALGLGAALVAGVYPACYAARTQPAAALNLREG